MKVLLVKMSSLGDVFHALPAVQDAYQQVPSIEFHWLVEEAFADIPSWHPAVTKVIPIAWRRWRKNLSNPDVRAEMKSFYQDLRTTEYDVVLDAQCLIKSAVVTRMAKGSRYGLDKSSCRTSCGHGISISSSCCQRPARNSTCAPVIFPSVGLFYSGCLFLWHR
jgi:heptosyltransferase-1